MIIFKEHELLEILRARISQITRMSPLGSEGLSGNLVGISINLCKSIQKELFINDTS